MPGYVLEEAPAGADGVDVPSDDGPKVPGVVSPPASSGDGEGLAGIAPGDEADASVVCGGEGTKVRVKRDRIQPPFLHARSQYLDCVGFDLNSSPEANASRTTGEGDSEVESPSAGTKGELGLDRRDQVITGHHRPPPGPPP